MKNIKADMLAQLKGYGEINYDFGSFAFLSLELIQIEQKLNLNIVFEPNVDFYEGLKCPEYLISIQAKGVAFVNINSYFDYEPRLIAPATIEQNVSEIYITKSVNEPSKVFNLLEGLIKSKAPEYLDDIAIYDLKSLLSGSNGGMLFRGPYQIVYEMKSILEIENAIPSILDYSTIAEPEYKRFILDDKSFFAAQSIEFTVEALQ